MSDPFLFTPEPFWQHLADVGKHMILPAVTLMLTTYGSFTLVTRSSMLETLGEDYVLTARAKGLPARRIVWRAAGGRVAARGAQRAATGGHADRAGTRLHRGRGGTGRGDLQLARHRAGHVQRHRPARLPHAAGRVPDP